MKNKIIKLVSAFMTICFVCVFASGCSNGSENKNKKQTDEKSGISDVKDVKNETSAQTQTQTNDENTKYGNAEVYKKNNIPYAKTDDGQEVELTGENMQKLTEEYMKVQGTGTDKEKELLNKIQLILEAPRE